MTNLMNLEGRTVARLRDTSTQELIGLLILWETGEIAPLWFDESYLKVDIEWLADEKIDGFDFASCR